MESIKDTPFVGWLYSQGLKLCLLYHTTDVTIQYAGIHNKIEKLSKSPIEKISYSSTGVIFINVKLNTMVKVIEYITMNPVLLFRCTNKNSIFFRFPSSSVASRQMGGADLGPRNEPAEVSLAAAFCPLYLKGPVATIKQAESLQAFFNPPAADILHALHQTPYIKSRVKSRYR